MGKYVVLDSIYQEHHIPSNNLGSYGTLNTHMLTKTPFTLLRIYKVLPI